MRPLAAALLLVLVGCSSAPPPPEGVQERKNRAADYLKFGQQAFQETKFEQALSYYLLAVDLDTAVDSEAGMAAAWNSVATAQTALRRMAEARASLLQAEAMAALSGDRNLVLQVAVSLVQSDLAAKDVAAARARLTALQPFPGTAEGAALDHALGTLEKDDEHLTEALAAFDRALAVNQRLGLKQEMAANRFMKASVLGRQADWAAARVELQAALTLDKVVENTLGIGQDWRALGSVSLKLDDPRSAYDAFVRAFRLFEAAGLTEEQRKTLVLLVPVATTLQRADAAARYQAVLDRLGPPQK